MGLDITAYKNLKKVENPILDEWGELKNWETEWKPGESMEWSEKHFPGRGEGIEPDSVYTFEEEFGFRAGSYSGYNWWRDHLYKFALALMKINEKINPFEELVNFADNEGVIGYVVAEKLKNDFVTHEEMAKKYSKKLQDGEWWLDKYNDWKKAFILASQNGAVDFH